MRFPDETAIEPLFDDVEFPEFARVVREQPDDAIDDVAGATETALDALEGGLPAGGSVAVGVGSRGIRDVVAVARTTVERLGRQGFDPVVVPAMGSHGGATPEGQREALAGLGLTEAALGCPIDARMATERIGEATVGDTTFEVHFSRAALEADAVLAINRVKPHTNFTGRIESGVAKMLTVGFGKQPGARTFHDVALRGGYVPTIETALSTIREAATVVGGIGIVENVHDRTAAVEPLPANDLLAREAELLTLADGWMATLPYEEIDVLIVDEIGKDVSGTGMDTNVIGRYRVLNAPDPETPDIKRIYVRNLTEATHGNGQGIGLADLTRTAVIDRLDLERVYANALTSGSLRKAKLPVVLPDDELALTTAVSAIGAYDPDTVRIVWIENTSELSTLRVSTALVPETPDDCTVTRRERLRFADGTMTFEPVDAVD